MTGAEVVQFPGTVRNGEDAKLLLPVVTIGRYASVPKLPPWKLAAAIPLHNAGWAVEALNHPAGGINIMGFHRDEATAWQVASSIAMENGWRAERNRRLAIAAARQMVAESRQ